VTANTPDWLTGLLVNYNDDPAEGSSDAWRETAARVVLLTQRRPALSPAGWERVRLLALQRLAEYPNTGKVFWGGLLAVILDDLEAELAATTPLE